VAASRVRLIEPEKKKKSPCAKEDLCRASRRHRLNRIAVGTYIQHEIAGLDRRACRWPWASGADSQRELAAERDIGAIGGDGTFGLAGDSPGRRASTQRA